MGGGKGWTMKSSRAQKTNNSKPLEVNSCLRDHGVQVFSKDSLVFLAIGEFREAVPLEKETLPTPARVLTRMSHRGVLNQVWCTVFLTSIHRK